MKKWILLGIFCGFCAYYTDALEWVANIKYDWFRDFATNIKG